MPRSFASSFGRRAERIIASLIQDGGHRLPRGEHRGSPGDGKGDRSPEDPFLMQISQSDLGIKTTRDLICKRKVERTLVLFYFNRTRILAGSPPFSASGRDPVGRYRPVREGDVADGVFLGRGQWRRRAPAQVPGAHPHVAPEDHQACPVGGEQHGTSGALHLRSVVVPEAEEFPARAASINSESGMDDRSRAAPAADTPIPDVIAERRARSQLESPPRDWQVPG